MNAAVMNRKGGVGKSALTLGLAATWAQRGRRILVVDLDPQATTTRTLGLDADRPGTDAFLHGESLEHCVDRVGDPWGFDVLGSTQALAGWDTDPSRLNREWRLSRAISKADGAYDQVLYDCAPSLGVLVVNALAASTHALLVTEPSGAAVDGLGLALELVAEVRQHMRPDLALAGVIVNGAEERERESRHFLAEVRRTFGAQCLEPPVPRRTAVRQAMSAHTPVQALNTPGAREVSAALATLATQLEELE